MGGEMGPISEQRVGGWSFARYQITFCVLAHCTSIRTVETLSVYHQSLPTPLNRMRTHNRCFRYDLMMMKRKTNIL